MPALLITDIEEGLELLPGDIKILRENISRREAELKNLLIEENPVDLIEIITRVAVIKVCRQLIRIGEKRAKG
jgi:hypothetical protein